jgi:hypothetical protein
VNGSTAKVSAISSRQPAGFGLHRMQINATARTPEMNAPRSFLLGGSGAESRWKYLSSWRSSGKPYFHTKPWGASVADGNEIGGLDAVEAIEDVVCLLVASVGGGAEGGEQAAAGRGRVTF